MASTQVAKPEVHAEVTVNLVKQAVPKDSCQRRQLRPGGV